MTKKPSRKRGFHKRNGFILLEFKIQLLLSWSMIQVSNMQICWKASCFVAIDVFLLNSSQYNVCYGSDNIVTEVIMTLTRIFLSLASRFRKYKKHYQDNGCISNYIPIYYIIFIFLIEYMYACGVIWGRISHM